MFEAGEDTMTFNLEATLFRFEQVDPLFDNLQVYPAKHVYVSLANAWLELDRERTGQNVPFNIVGASIPGASNGDWQDCLVKLFDSRMVPVEARPAKNRKLNSVTPISIKTLICALSKTHETTRKPPRNTPSVIIQDISVLSEQLMTFSHWLNSYHDKRLELCFYSGNKRAYLLLQKPHTTNDTPYRIVGSTPEGDITSFLADLFNDSHRVKAYASSKCHNIEWNLSAPKVLDEFVLNVTQKYDEKRRHVKELQ